MSAEQLQKLVNHDIAVGAMLFVWWALGRGINGKGGGSENRLQKRH